MKIEEDFRQKIQIKPPNEGEHSRHASSFNDPYDIPFLANDRSWQLCTQRKQLRKQGLKKFRIERDSNP